VGPWGVVYGTFAFLAAFGVTLARLGGPLQRRLGYLVLAFAAGLLSAGAGFLIVAERVPPLTSSGAWLWPLAVCPAVVAVVAVAGALRPASDRARSDRR
jgi:peptidoglycan/LPS O-acetylase OafA/YrhL